MTHHKIGLYNSKMAFCFCYICVCMCVCVLVCVYEHVCSGIYLLLQTHTCTHKHAFIWKYKYKWTLFDSWCYLSVKMNSNGSMIITFYYIHSETRYLLILTENYAALSILQQELLENDKTTIIFGSSFPKDQEYTQVCLPKKLWKQNRLPSPSWVVSSCLFGEKSAYRFYHSFWHWISI